MKKKVANMSMRIDRTSDRLVADGLAVRELAASGKSGAQVLNALELLADELLGEAVEVEDIGVDLCYAKQDMTLGHSHTPNRPLREREKRVEMLKRLRAESKEKARASCELVEGQVTR